MSRYEDLTIDQGTDVAIELQLVNEDGTIKSLSGYSAKAQLRETYNSKDSDATNFTTTIASPTNSGILTLSLTNAQTSALKAGRYVYDVEISFVDSSSNTIIERILEGRVTVTPEVTR